MASCAVGSVFASLSWQKLAENRAKLGTPHLALGKRRSPLEAYLQAGPQLKG